MKKRWITAGTAVLLIAVIGIYTYVQNRGQESGHEQRKFGATYMTMNNPYFEAMNENIKESVEVNGDILITRDPLQDQDKQNEQIEDMVEEGISALFLNPVSWKGVAPSLKLCKEKGIPVFVIDTDVYDRENVVSTIISDNYNAGVQCAKDMMEKRDRARIVIINHIDINSTNQRVQGFLDTIEGHDEYKVVIQKRTTAELEVAMEVMKEILNSGEPFDVVLGGNDPTALGCLAAMQMTHVEKDILLYGIDGSPDAKAMIKAGYMEGTSAQSPIRIASTAASTAYKYLRGEKVDNDITIPVTLITEENLKEFDVAGWQ